MQFSIDGNTIINFSKDLKAPINLRGTNNLDIILLHGLKSNARDMRGIAHKLNPLGYNVIALNYLDRISDFRKGEMDEWLNAFFDVHNFIRSRENGVILIGSSLGGLFALTLGWLNDNVKQVFGISAPCGGIIHNKEHMENLSKTFGFKLNIDESEEILFPYNYFTCKKSNKEKFFLIHSMNDSIIPISEFYKNKELLCIPDENTLVFKNVTGIGMFDHVLLQSNKRTHKFIINNLIKE